MFNTVTPDATSEGSSHMMIIIFLVIILYAAIHYRMTTVSVIAHIWLALSPTLKSKWSHTVFKVTRRKIVGPGVCVVFHLYMDGSKVSSFVSILLTH